MHNYAQWLANFLEWTQRRGIDLATCSYSAHIQGRYQSEMLAGTWSRSGRANKPNTVNLRVQQACDFLNWMVAKGHRGPFAVPYRTVQLQIGTATSSLGHLSKTMHAREGKVSIEERYLRMPSDESVKEWLAQVYETAGETSGLMCECILLSAMRREEIVCLRNNTLQENPIDWHIANPLAPHNDQQVRLQIKYGAKGRSFGVDNGDKVGPARTILIPLELAKKLHAYRNNIRNRAVKRRLQGVTSKEARLARVASAVHLFLREDNGERFTGKRLYDDWVGVELPSPGWSPHQGRHWWACSVLWRELHRHEHAFKLSGGEMVAALLESSALSVIRLQIQPQLGHTSASTTMIYLRWVMDMMGTPLSLDGNASPSP